MMQRYSKPRDPQGNFDQMRLLDAHLSLESMLVRETVQNAWDARDLRRGRNTPVHWGLRLEGVEGPKLRRLRAELGDAPPGGLPPAAAEGRSLDEVLEDDVVSVLFVDDRNTLGLGGPAVSNVPCDPVERRFARFLLDMGRPPGITVGGGTYGYGKTVLWRTSECATVVAYSRFRQGRVTRSRLMGAAMGDPYEFGMPRTGRHWWGRLDPDANVLPLEGEAADELALTLGLWEEGDDRTGTSVMIVGSRFRERGDLVRLREAARWHCWPKWSRIDGQVEMAFHFRHGGEELPALDSTGDAHIAPFAAALEKALEGGGRPCEVLRPHVVAGHLVTEYATDRREPEVGVEEDDDVRPVPFPLNHAALVRRGPRLHVRYEEYPHPPPDGVIRAGVFLTAEDQRSYSPETAFADAEPPTHDDWSWRGLTGTDKTIVRMGLKRLSEQMHGGSATEARHGSTDGLGRLANHLGTMLDEGSGPSAPTRGRGGGAGRPRELQVRERSIDRVIFDDVPYVVLEFDIEGRSGRPALLRPSIRVVDGDRRTSDVDDDTLTSTSWVHEELDLELAESEMLVDEESPDAGWSLWVPMYEPRRLRLSVRAEYADG